jgi:hypothetical protein
MLAIIFPGIERREHGRLKDFPGIGKIKPVLANVSLILLLISFKTHDGSLT